MDAHLVFLVLIFGSVATAGQALFGLFTVARQKRMVNKRLKVAEKVEGVSALVRAIEAASRLQDGRQADTVAALQAADAATQAERDADAAERAALGALMRTPQTDCRALFLGVEIARALESVTDHVAHAALALRGRLLEELSL